jgi:carbon monoxide dehydrogenase subunit G
MLRFEGDRIFPGAPETVFATLTNVPFLIPCVPDVQTVKAIRDDGADLVLKPGFAFVRGTLDVSMNMRDVSAPTSVRFEMTSKGIGSSAAVEASLAFAPHEHGTVIHWIAEVKSLGGLLKLVPAGLIRGAAEKVINDAWDRITTAFPSSPPPVAEGTSAG